MRSDTDALTADTINEYLEYRMKVIVELEVRYTATEVHEVELSDSNFGVLRHYAQ